MIALWMAMVWASSSHAGPAVTLASFCAALLENQSVATGDDRENVDAVLAEFESRAWLYRDHVSTKRYDESNYADHVFALGILESDVAQATEPTFSLHLLTERIAQLRVDATSIRHGVTAWGTIKRGKREIEGFFRDLDQIARRNERALDEVRERVFPYVRPWRLAKYGTGLTASLAYAAAFSHAFGEALKLPSGDLVALAGLTINMPLIAGAMYSYMTSAFYTIGLLDPNFRRLFELKVGDFKSAFDTFAFTSAGEFIAAHVDRPNAFVFKSGNIVVSEREKLALEVAARGQRAPSPELYRSFEGTPQNKRSWAEIENPHVLKIDQGFYNDDAGEPVFFSFQRFERIDRPTGRRRKPKDEPEAKVWAPGGLVPQR